MADSGGFNRNSVSNILIVAVGVSLFCSVMVSVSAVVLKARQDANVLLDRQHNILVAAGSLAEGEETNAAGQSAQEIFSEQFEERIVDLASGRFVSESEDFANYSALRAAKDPSLSMALDADQDIATILRREQYARVYLRKNATGRLETLVLPVRGYGLWGTLYGYLAIRNDFETISGLGFYTHKETPGLGGEVDNPSWKAQWPGKRLYNSAGKPAIRLLKIGAGDQHSVDALAGASLTSRGVENLIKFWTGELGFGPFLKNLRSSGGT